jgi:sugar O-acyltransferase (sialic acid O-acetyltransferase NeuD family)
MSRGLVLLGAGGLAREVMAFAETAGWTVHGLLDDDPAKQGGRVSGRPVLGPGSELPSLLDREPGLAVALCLGSPRRPAVRLEVAGRLGLPEDRWATVVHPTALLEGGSTVGPGSIVLAGVVATADVRLGEHCVVMPGCVLTHDDRLDRGATLAAGVRLAGDVHVGEGAYVGSGALVREGVRIGAGAVVGLGAVVLRDVPDGEVWAGNPAAPLDRAQRGERPEGRSPR